jgi:mannan endo-1,4-beta-mannosidase
MNWLVSIVLSLGLCIQFGFGQVVFKASQAQLFNVNVVQYAGQQAVKMDNEGSIRFTVNTTQKAFYKITMRVATPSGNKTQDLYVNNGFVSQIAFPGPESAFFTQNLGTIMLPQGANEIEIRKNWGYMYFESLLLQEVPPNDYSITEPGLVNSHSDSTTMALYQFLRSQYGKRILSGQTAYWDELIDISGKTPIVRAFDFQSYTQGYPYLWQNGGHTFGWQDVGTTQQAIDWYNQMQGKGIVSFQWHWHSPSGGQPGTNTFYTDHTSFDASQAVVAGTPENILVLQDIDSIASQLKRLQDAGIPVLWRPLHEAGGAWFWWGAKGAQPCLILWDMVYNRLTKYHQLNNLIWVWSSPEPEWYPGNDKVDIIGYDSYPGEFVYGTQKAIFNSLYDIVQGKKMIAMTENGPIPSIDALIEEDAMWLYFSSWSDLVIEQNTAQHIQQVYSHPLVVTGEAYTIWEESPTSLSLPSPNPLPYTMPHSYFRQHELFTPHGRRLQSTGSVLYSRPSSLHPK